MDHVYISFPLIPKYLLGNIHLGTINIVTWGETPRSNSSDDTWKSAVSIQVAALHVDFVFLFPLPHRHFLLPSIN